MIDLVFELNGVSAAPVMPSPLNFSFSLPISQETVITLSGKRVVTRAANPQGSVLTLKSGFTCTEAFRAALDAAWLAGGCTLRESLSDRHHVRTWLDLSMSAEPSWTEYGENDDLVIYSLDNALVFLGGIPNG